MLWLAAEVAVVRISSELDSTLFLHWTCDTIEVTNIGGS